MTGGREGEVLRFTFDGRPYEGRRGDTLAAALLANGVRRIGTSVTLGRPRGIFGAWTEEPNAVVQIERPFPEPMVQATTIPLYEGLAATGLAGRGRLSPDPDPARYDATHAHCDVLVVGAGPAGLTAALAAARTGARVILADDRPHAGGTLPDTGDMVEGMPGTEWALGVAAELASLPGARVLPRTSVIGYYDHNYLVAVERRGEEAVTRERVWRIRARRVVLATGAHERPIAFGGNDLPGVMLASAARAYVNRYGVLPGRRAVIFTTGDSGYDAARDLAAAGVEVAAVADTRKGHLVTATAADPDQGLHRVEITSSPSLSYPVEADLLLVSGGWNPVLHLYGQAGGRLRYDEGIAAFVPDGTAPPGQAAEVIGSARGIFTLAGCLADGEAAGTAAPLPAPPPSGPSPEHLWLVPSGDYTNHFVDLQRDVTVADLQEATSAGLRSVEHVKRYTTAGTAHDQGKTSGTLTSAIIAGLLGVGVGELGTTTFRAPYVPVSFAALAGRDRGALADPVRVTAPHDRHVSQGALFENVGQWKRPWYYPLPGEDMEAAVLRECRAVRRATGAMDASTLGKIDLQGPDAAELLDRLYTNMMSTLKVGAIRYGVMCKPDGMVFDDGTVIRLAPDRFLVTTTTGNAAAVLDWMEEWLQTEWPHLRVRCTSVTEQWATVALAGPGSRDVLAGLAPDLAVDAASFPFMTWRDTEVVGIEARVCRISFSGELAYEINVAWWHGLALWDSIMATGAVTPYGTETMHVLRAEKGYPIVGQDTDGTVTPADLGMDWVISKKKPDFLGKRSYSRAGFLQAARRELVGLLPDDPDLLVPEGSQLVACDRLPEPPVPMLGHVTSSYRSAALGRTFALALVTGGRARLGDRLYAPIGDTLAPVTITHSVLYDPDNTRRDGEPPTPPDTPASAAGHEEPADVAALSHAAGHREEVDLPSRPHAAPERLSPLTAFHGISDTRLRVHELPFLPMTNLRLLRTTNLHADPEPAAVSRLPVEPGTWLSFNGADVVWLGPDEWLVIGDSDLDLPRSEDVAVTDVSAQRTTLLVAGPGARDLLAHGCALDLHPSVFGPGRCAQTTLAQAQVILIAREHDEFWILVRSSYARYLTAWLSDATTDL
ncbi:2Fe-2S iron-sulfur cluster-binding protein [Sphaerisporangium corydalis]|uniref:2Fe-2S iron-sulfur cluster-binding protein n=1 Tax=Sphaerisporangium corydalis TaxID=1441875 RepID=A0ABV9ENW8_9ACTN|nr:2Fe-2S iron-sulfur cluster-binding protein [Sphaerisporangium corydalis]